MGSKPLNNDSYTVGWVCVLEVELAACQAMLDKQHPDLPVVKGDSNSYVLGSIGNHNVVITAMPTGRPGPTPAATTAVNLLRSFPNIRFGFMIGVGGGAPGNPQADPAKDIRLGDIVVGCPSGQNSGVLQYDFGTALHGDELEQKDEFERKGLLNHMPTILATSLAKLRADTRLKGWKFPSFLDSVIKAYPDSGFGRPDRVDQLFVSHYKHIKHEVEDCSQCNVEQTIKRLPRKKPDTPIVHYGAIGSGNTFVRSPALRDRLRKESNLLCIETEVGSLINDFPCIVIRGICDYCDSHENKDWQPYAAAAAAAFGKELLLKVSSLSVEQEQPAREVVGELKRITQPASKGPKDISQKLLLDGHEYAREASLDTFSVRSDFDSEYLPHGTHPTDTIENDMA